MNKVFVYGSLLSGLGNHGLLSSSKMLGKTKSPANFQMVDIGWFPGVIKAENGIAITGEVYEVDDITLARLNRLEGYNSTDPDSGLYNRDEIDTEFGKAFIYIYNDHYGHGHLVESGDWKTYHDLKRIK